MYALAVIYGLFILLASLAGGWIPLVLRLTHTRMQVALSFVAGVMLGVGLLHLLPHGFMALRHIDRTAGWVLVGFMLMFFLERLFHFHHHDAPDDEVFSPDCDHPDHDHPPPQRVAGVQDHAGPSVRESEDQLPLESHRRRHPG